MGCWYQAATHRFWTAARSHVLLQLSRQPEDVIQTPMSEPGGSRRCEKILQLLLVSQLVTVDELGHSVHERNVLPLQEGGRKPWNVLESTVNWT